MKAALIAFLLAKGATSAPTLFAAPAQGDTGPVYGPELEGFEYPIPVRQFQFTSQGVKLHMAYLDQAPAAAHGRTVVLLHGKNFTAATWSW